MSISVISACMNRGEALTISLSSWIQFEEIDEIILVDWSSKNPINHLTKLHKKVKVITVPNEKYFNQPQPLNLAASISTKDFILKLDCDTILNPYFNFFKKYKINEGNFISGRNPSKYPYITALWGTLYLSKSDFNKIGGYNENMGDYAAWEDSEILIRLDLLGLKQIDINLKYLTCFSIPHPHKKRIENFKFYDVDKTIEKKIRRNYDMPENKINYTILMKHHQINSEQYKPTGYYIEPAVKWDIRQISDQHYVAQKIVNK